MGLREMGRVARERVEALSTGLPRDTKTIPFFRRIFDGRGGEIKKSKIYRADNYFNRGLA